MNVMTVKKYSKLVYKLNMWTREIGEGMIGEQISVAEGLIRDQVGRRCERSPRIQHSLKRQDNNQFSSVTQWCLTLWDTMHCSKPGFPVHHQLPGPVQTYVHPVTEDIQPSHPRLLPSLPAFNLSQHQGLFQWVSSSLSGPISLRIGWFDLLAVQGTLKSLLRYHN